MIWRDEPVRPVKIVYIFKVLLYHIGCAKISNLKLQYYYIIKLKTGLHKTSKGNVGIIYNEGEGILNEYNGM